VSVQHKGQGSALLRKTLIRMDHKKLGRRLRNHNDHVGRKNLLSFGVNGQLPGDFGSPGTVVARERNLRSVDNTRTLPLQSGKQSKSL
jgi:hypothetical protein